ncbi:MAG: glycosyltransferase [Bacteroidetes bacterium]|nr:glycosyltransferase [Bacteroidota bacterium]
MSLRKTLPLITTPVRVVIPAFKATNTINACLNNILIACNNFKDIEVVVVAFETRISIPFNAHLRIIELAKPLNAGEARNLGAADCNNRILVFVDADVLIDPSSLHILINPIIKGNADATVGNYATDLMNNKFFQNYKKLYINQAYAADGYITNEFWTAYAAISGKAFLKVGQFSEKFRFKGGEDTEIGVRLSTMKFKIYAVAGVYGKHLKDFTFASLIKNDFIKGSRTIFLALHRKMPLQENRHAKKSDQLAVAAACGLILLFTIGTLLHWVWLFMPLLLAVYIASRFNFMSACVKQGAWFTIRAFAMAWLLDIVRATSILNGIFIFYRITWFGSDTMSAPVIQMQTNESQTYVGSRA